MISLVDVYHVVTATVPLYVAMILAYVSVRWWKLFTPEQCSGINKFVAKFSIPLLSFQILSENNPYKMNLKLILSDFVQKLLAFLVLTVVTRVRSKGGLNFIITGLSVSILPNTLILGIPLLKAMYGDEAAKMLAQIVALQSLIWYNLLLFMYEFNAAKSAASVSPSLEATEELENPQELQQPKEEVEDGISRTSTVPLKIKTGVILLTVGKKLMENPNTHATAIGLVWACIKYKWKVDLPEIAGQSIKILADGGLGMAMFSLGLFMASRPSIIACGTRMAIISMGFKFIGGPFLMAAASLAIGLRHTQLRVAIVQAALPQGIVPFVFAKEYNVHPDILSTGAKPKIWLSELIPFLLPLPFLFSANSIFISFLSANMGKGPGLYTDIGKKARDLLYKDYQTDQKFTLTTYSPTGVAITSSGTKKGELFLADVNTQLKNKNITTDIKVDTNSNLIATVTVDEACPGLKTILSFRVPDQRSGKVELQYLHEYAGISTSVGLTANPIVNFSGVIGTNAVALGTDVSFDSKTGNFTKFNGGLSFTNADLLASLTVNDKGDTLSASYYHIVNPFTSTAVGAEATHSFSSNENTFTVGAQHALDPLTSVKARVNNLGKASALIQHEWRPKSFFTISGDVDTKAIEKSAKVGLALVLKP
ncbi:hypothetical protein G4B88_029076 [Cannabis sativa]|uniref:Auxin efflux carrier component n=1 Tax=Cannabis sativa TaxID=3483 RepID=A0A7J6DZ85_CANSA|nr:hypothetical protein G4B88_029076 [Cannabis sativa]